MKKLTDKGMNERTKRVDFFQLFHGKNKLHVDEFSGSKLFSITTQLHYGGHLGGRARLPGTILEEDLPMTIPSKFGSN